MKLRLFFALWPEGPVREAIARAGTDGALEAGRRVRAGNLHLTLQFLGDIDSAVCKQLISAAERVAVPRFSLQLDTSGWWKTAKTAWLGPSRVPRELQALHDALYKLAGLQQIPVDERSYRPHVTLARRLDAPVELRFEPILWNVTDFCLIESIPHTGYVEYGIIRRWTLT